MRQVKGKILHQGGAVVGVCPDMCPEKERYLREYQRRLSKFEMIPGTEGVSVLQCIWDCSLFPFHLPLPSFPTPSPPFPTPLQLATPAVDHSTAVKEYSKSAADQVGVGLARWGWGLLPGGGGACCQVGVGLAARWGWGLLPGGGEACQVGVGLAARWGWGLPGGGGACCASPL